MLIARLPQDTLPDIEADSEAIRSIAMLQSPLDMDTFRAIVNTPITIPAYRPRRQEAYEETLAKKLGKKWDNLPTRSTLGSFENWYSIESLEKKYTNKELDVLISNTIGVELTRKCGSNCPFCLYELPSTVPQKGITGELWFTDHKRLLELLQEHRLPEEADFYHATDPLDISITAFMRHYHDIFLPLSSDIKPLTLTTAVPVGKEQELADLIIYLAAERIKAKRDKMKTPPTRKRDVEVVLSVNDANEERIKLALALVFLKHEGIKDDDPIDFFPHLDENYKQMDDADRLKLLNEIVKIKRMGDKTTLKVGRRINERHMAEVQTPSCRRGVVLSTKEEEVNGKKIIMPCFKAVVPVAATKYCPSGEASWEIPPMKVEELTPKLSMKNQVLTGAPDLENANGEPLKLENPCDNTILHLGAALLSLDTTVEHLTRIPYSDRYKRILDRYEHNFQWVSDILVKENLAKKMFQINARISEINDLLEKNTDPDRREELEYYKKIALIHSLRGSILISAVSDCQNITTLSYVAEELQLIRDTDIHNPENEQRFSNINNILAQK